MNIYSKLLVMGIWSSRKKLVLLGYSDFCSVTHQIAGPGSPVYWNFVSMLAEVNDVGTSMISPAFIYFLRFFFSRKKEYDFFFF